jgi:hypothetical protein
VALLCFLTYSYFRFPSFTAKGHAHNGMYSDLKRPFDQICEYYKEVTVSLLTAERRLKTIRETMVVTPDDKLLWELIRDACKDPYRLLAAEVKYMHHMPQHIPSYLMRPVTSIATAHTPGNCQWFTLIHLSEHQGGS